MNEIVLWAVIFLLAGFVFFWVKRIKSDLLNFLFIVSILPLVLVLYLSAHKFYYYLAVNSSLQQRHCGIFHQYKPVVRYSKTGNWTQNLYEFKTEHGQIFVFVRDRAVAKHLPLMAYIQPQQKICFQYSPKFKDSDERYLLTDLSLQK
ncbi:hypothetical protein [Acinetobacter haemolyticus]|uniref:hypothetical protein n=1 Tax=Acinetobacter haemolyticus TaxID=29430 RepID=UPI0002F190DB|nr:hypothetical protein [Acinetobacter haemolyticus]NAR97840.1 hypothetical protein [Acinetobacter haemolyticus]SUU09596.1 Uncharacterised protein [Acinetobacter haemolyticus]